MAEAYRAARQWAMAVKSAEVSNLLAEAGVRNALIKGAALSARLYDPREPRAYNDCDLLVAPRQADRAEQVLKSAGFAANTTDARGPHASLWTRADDGFHVDLHHTLPSLRISPGRLWRILGERLEPLEVGGRTVLTLDEPATALLAAVHAAHHGQDLSFVTADLTRAAEGFPRDTWIEARDLAWTLGITDLLVHGLGTTDAGRDLARDIGLDATERISGRSTDAPRGSASIDELILAGTWRRRARAAVRLLRRGFRALVSPRRGSDDG